MDTPPHEQNIDHKTELEWTHAIDKVTGKEYWFNRRLGKSTWENPNTSATRWIKQMDPGSGRPFWYDTVKGISTWHDPQLSAQSAVKQEEAQQQEQEKKNKQQSPFLQSSWLHVKESSSSKWSGKSKWVRRWCALDDHQVAWFASRGSMGAPKQLVGVFHFRLRGTCCVKAVEGKRKNCFEIKDLLSGESALFSSDNHSEMENWIRAVEEVLRANGKKMKKESETPNREDEKQTKPNENATSKASDLAFNLLVK